MNITTRVYVLYTFLEKLMLDAQKRGDLSKMVDEDLRVEPLGKDRFDNHYYYFQQFHKVRRILSVSIILSAN